MNATIIQKHFTGLCLLLLFLTLGSVSARAQTTYVTNEGATIEVSVRPEKETILLGEPVYVIFEVRNLSNETFMFQDSGDYRNRLGRPESYRISAKRKDGKEVPVPEIALGFGGLIGTWTIQSQGEYRRKLFLPLWAPIEKPGVYRISLRKFLPLKNRQTKLGSPIQAEVETTIEVLPPDEARLGNVITEIGARMLDSDDDTSKDATYAMTFIKDRRTIPFFIRVLEDAEQVEPGHFHIQNVRNAGSALASYAENDTLAGLEKAAASINDEIRLAIADGLCLGKHPKARALLATMWKDSFWFVRLRVAQGLQKETSSVEYRKILEALARDENEEVRKTAKQALEPDLPEDPD
jgi:hypothetical protein